jgi:hypothetical protein
LCFIGKDITADSFVKWRSEQKKAAKTLNEYLACAKASILAIVGSVTSSTEVKP